MQTYTVACECGFAHEVAAKKAGSVLSCSCGKSVDVPTLSTLRRSAGQSAIPQTTVERIAAMVNTGELPLTDSLCPITNRSADHTALFHVECERAAAVGSDSASLGQLILLFLVGGFGKVFAGSGRRGGSAKDHGRDVFITIPFRLSSTIASTVTKMSQKKLRKMLSQTPVYSELFDEYPSARITALETRT